MGFLLGKSASSLTEFETVKQNISFTEFKTMERSIGKSIKSYNFREKGSFSYDFQFMDEGDFRNLLYLIKNRNSLQEGLLLVPIPYNEEQSSVILAPVSGENQIYKGSILDNFPWNLPYNDLDKTEFNSTEYAAVSTVDEAYVLHEPATDYLAYFLFSFDVSDFITEYSYKEIRRLLFNMSGMVSSPLRLFIWSPTFEQWYLIDDVTHFNSDDFTNSDFYLYKTISQGFSLPYGCSSIYQDFVDTNSKVKFMLSAQRPDQKLLMNYFRLLINSYNVMSKDSQKIEDYSTSFTGAGRYGTLELEEI